MRVSDPLVGVIWQLGLKLPPFVILLNMCISSSDVVKQYCILTEFNQSFTMIVLYVFFFLVILEQKKYCSFELPDNTQYEIRDKDYASNKSS